MLETDRCDIGRKRLFPDIGTIMESSESHLKHSIVHTLSEEKLHRHNHLNFKKRKRYVPSLRSLKDLNIVGVQIIQSYLHPIDRKTFGDTNEVWRNKEPNTSLKSFREHLRDHLTNTSLSIGSSDMKHTQTIVVDVCALKVLQDIFSPLFYTNSGERLNVFNRIQYR